MMIKRGQLPLITMSKNLDRAFIFETCIPTINSFPFCFKSRGVLIPEGIIKNPDFMLAVDKENTDVANALSP